VNVASQVAEYGSEADMRFKITFGFFFFLVLVVITSWSFKMSAFRGVYSEYDEAMCATSQDDERRHTSPMCDKVQSAMSLPRRQIHVLHRRTHNSVNTTIICRMLMK